MRRGSEGINFVDSEGINFVDSEGITDLIVVGQNC